MNEMYDTIKQAIENYMEEVDDVQLEEVIGALHILQLQFEAVMRVNLINALHKEKDDAN
jgi:hypothetical protein